MVLARIEFKPEHAAAFIEAPGSTQNIIEQTFESVEALIETLKEFEPFIKNCVAIVNGRVLALSEFKTK
jgi:hypothetical protein